MTTPQITDLPTVPLTSDPDFKTTSPAWLNYIKNITVPELNALIAYINAASWLDTPLAVASGGTGLSSLTAGRIPYGAGTSALGNSGFFVFDPTNYYLGIGKASPGKSLDMQSTTGLAIRMYVGSTLKVGMESATSDGQMISSSLISDLAIRSLGNILFSTVSNTEMMRLSTGGNLGVGKTDPETKLDVNGQIRPGTYTVATAPAGQTGAIIFVTDDVGGSVHAFYDGSDWRRMTDRAVISTT